MTGTGAITGAGAAGAGAGTAAGAGAGASGAGAGAGAAGAGAACTGASTNTVRGGACGSGASCTTGTGAVDDIAAVERWYLPQLDRLHDDAAREAVAMAEGAKVRIIDASTAHRVAPGWTYGFPELVGREAVANATRVANPGCYPTGFLALVAPLVRAMASPR